MSDRVIGQAKPLAEMAARRIASGYSVPDTREPSGTEPMVATFHRVAPRPSASAQSPTTSADTLLNHLEQHALSKNAELREKQKRLLKILERKLKG